MMTTTPSQNGPWIVMFKVHARVTRKWAAVATLVTDRESLWTARRCTIWDIDKGAWLRKVDADCVTLASRQGLGWNWCDPVAFVMFHGMDVGVDRGESKWDMQSTRQLKECPPITAAGGFWDIPGEPQNTRQQVLDSL